MDFGGINDEAVVALMLFLGESLSVLTVILVRLLVDGLFLVFLRLMD